MDGPELVPAPGQHRLPGPWIDFLARPPKALIDKGGEGLAADAPAPVPFHRQVDDASLASQLLVAAPALVHLGRQQQQAAAVRQPPLQELQDPALLVGLGIAGKETLLAAVLPDGLDLPGMRPVVLEGARQFRSIPRVQPLLPRPPLRPQQRHEGAPALVAPALLPEVQGLVQQIYLAFGGGEPGNIFHHHVAGGDEQGRGHEGGFDLVPGRGPAVECRGAEIMVGIGGDEAQDGATRSADAKLVAMEQDDCRPLAFAEARQDRFQVLRHPSTPRKGHQRFDTHIWFFSLQV